jgi:hypothetical protein
MSVPARKRDQDLVDETVLDVDSTRVGAREIAEQLFIRRWVLKGK